MNVVRFDHRKFIDRVEEQQRFDELLEFRTASRLLAIRDKGGRGKSTLLRMLHFKCSNARHAVSLVELDRLDPPTPFGLVWRIRRDLRPLGWEAFERLNDARVSKDYSPFWSSGAVRATFNASNASITGGVQAAVLNKFEKITAKELHMNFPAQGSWSPEQEDEALERCTEAFLQDLKRSADLRAVILLLDAYDRAPVELQEWIERAVLTPLCFDESSRPEHLVLVVAGRELPDFEYQLGRERYERLVHWRPLGDWEDGHVKAFLELNGFPAFTDQDIGALRRKINEGLSLEKALATARLWQSEEGND